MNTPDNFKNHIHEREIKLSEQLKHNSLYKKIKYFAKIAFKTGKPIEPIKDDENIAKRFVYDKWCWRIDIGDHKSDFLHPNKSLSMVNKVELSQNQNKNKNQNQNQNKNITNLIKYNKIKSRYRWCNLFVREKFFVKNHIFF